MAVRLLRAVAVLALLAPATAAPNAIGNGNVQGRFRGTGPGVRLTMNAAPQNLQWDNEPTINSGIFDDGTDVLPATPSVFNDGPGLCTCTGCSQGALVVTAGVCFCGGQALLDVAATNYDFNPPQMTVQFKTAPAGTNLAAPRTLTLSCRVEDDTNRVAGTFDMKVELHPQTNQPPILTSAYTATTNPIYIWEDLQQLPPIRGVAPAKCGTLTNAANIAAGPEWELVPNGANQGVPDYNTVGDRVQFVGCAVDAARTTCFSATGNCLNNLAGTTAPPLPAGSVRFDMTYCVEPDAVGTVVVQCTFRDTGPHCCQGALSANDATKCPAELLAHCNALTPSPDVIAEYQFVIQEVNDVPVGYFDAATFTALNGGTFRWQEDCGLSGYELDCVTGVALGAVRPNHETGRLIVENMVCDEVSAAQPKFPGLTLYNRCTGGGTLNSVSTPDGKAQAHDIATSENVAAGADQTYIIACRTTNDALFMNAGTNGCPDCGGLADCGCPKMGQGTFPHDSGLNYMPARHAVGSADVVCYLEDVNPAAPLAAHVLNAGTGNAVGGATAAEGGVQRRMLAEFSIVIAEVNDPPSLQTDPRNVFTPTPLIGSTDPVDALPRVLFRKDPSWVGPTQTLWPVGVNPDPDGCTVVDCCEENGNWLAAAVTVTGKEPNPANLAGATGSIRVQDCPADRQQKCCAMDNVWMESVWVTDANTMLGCGARVTPALCVAGIPGCGWTGPLPPAAGGSCIHVGYGPPADTAAKRALTGAPTFAGYVGTLAGPLSEQGSFLSTGAQPRWDQQWNVKCKVACDATKKPLSYYGPGLCEAEMFEAAVLPYTLSSHCHDTTTKANCDPLTTPWPSAGHVPHQLVFRASENTGFGRKYKRGAVRVQCTMVDEYMPDATVECKTPPVEGAQNLYGEYISGCVNDDNPVLNQACYGTLLTEQGLPCPSAVVEDNLVSPIMDFIIEFTAPNYTLSDYPTANGLFDNIKDPWWEISVSEDEALKTIRNYLRDPSTWATGAEIDAMKGLITSVTHDTALFTSTGAPIIANLLPPDGGDVVFEMEKDMSGHTWVVIGIRDDGGGDPTLVNGPAYEEYLFWIEEVNDPPIATLDPSVAPSGVIHVDEDTLIRTGGHALLLFPDAAAGPPRELRDMPSALVTSTCPLTNTFPGCGVIPITAADATTLKYNRELCATTCGTGATCGCGQQLQITCTSDHPEFFNVEPSVDFTGTDVGMLRFTLKEEAAGDVKVTCAFKDCVDALGVPCTLTTDGEAALTTVREFVISIRDINDPPTIELTNPTLQIIVDEDSPIHTATVLQNLAPGPASELLTQIVDAKCTVKQGSTQLFENELITTTQLGNQGTIQQGAVTFTPAKDAAGQVAVVCQASDNGSPVMTSHSQSFEIIIREINDPPSGTLLMTEIEVEEDRGAYSVKLIDNLIPGPPSELSQTLTIVCKATNTVLLTGDPTINSAGTLTFTPAPDAVGVTSVNCVFTDDGVNPAALTWQTTFTIKVTEVNDPPTVTVNGVMMSPTITVSEDTGKVEESTFLIDLSPGPLSEHATQSTSFACSAANPELFSQQPSIVPQGSTGTVLFFTEQDMAGRTTVSCVMTDTGVPAKSTSFSFFVVINEINDPPIATVTENPLRVNEDDPPVIRTGFLSPLAAGPPQEAGQSFSTTCTNNPAFFLIRPEVDTSGTLTFTLQPDVSGTVSVTCSVVDAGGLQEDVTFTVEIDEVNDPPIVLQTLSMVLVDEDTGAYDRVQWTKLAPGPANEVAAGQIFTYTCSHTNPQLFVLGKTPEVVRTSSIARLSFEPSPDQAGESKVTCQLTDTGSPPASTEVEFTIVIRDLNDAPTATCTLCATGITVQEDSGWHSSMNFLTLISAGPVSEADQTLTTTCTTSGADTLWYKDSTVTPAIDGRPRIDPLTGALTFQPNTDTSGSSTVSCTLTDNGTPQGLLTLTSFVITVEEVNDPPLGTVDPSGRASVAVGSGSTTMSAWVTGIAPGPPQESTQSVRITCVADTPALFTTTGQPTLDRVSGDLTFTAATDNSEGNSLVTCTLTDNGLPTVETLTLSFVVAFENQPPTATATQEFVVVAEESGPYTLASFLTNLAAGPAVEVAKGQSIATIVCTPTDTSLFSVSPVINNQGVLEFTPAVDAAGSTFVDCLVNDNGQPQKSVGLNFTVNVTEVNDPPVVTVNQGSVTAPEGGDKVLIPSFVSVSAGPPSENLQTVRGSCVANIPELVEGTIVLGLSGFSLQNPIGSLEFTPAKDLSGTTTVKCTVSDDGIPVMTSEFEFELIISETNDPPTATLTRTEVTLDEDVALFEVLNMFTGLSPGPQAEIDKGETYTINCLAGDNSLFTLAGRPKVNSAGTLSMIPAPDMVGTTKVDCTIADSGSPSMSIMKSFTVTVAEKNDAPLAVVTQERVTVAEDSDVSSFPGFVNPLSPGPASESTQTIKTTCFPTNAALFSTSVSIASFGTKIGELSFKPAQDAVGVTEVKCDVVDSNTGTEAPLTTSFSFTVEITEVNDPPTGLLKLMEISVQEDIGTFVSKAFLYQVAPGPTSEDSQVVTTTCVAEHTALFSSPPLIASTGDLTFVPAKDVSGKTDVTCTMTDNGSPAASTPLVFSVTILDTNDPPTGTLSRSMVSAAEDAGNVEFADFITGMSGGPALENGQTFTTTCLAEKPEMFKNQPTIAQQSPTVGKLLFTPADNAVGSTSVTCTIADDVTPPGETKLTFSVTLTETNDEPVVTYPGENNVKVTQDIVKRTYTYPSFLQALPGPESEGTQGLDSECLATNPELFEVQPTVNVINGGQGNLSFVAKAGLSEANAITSKVTCTFSDNGMPPLTTSTTFDIDFELPKSPALLDTYRKSPEYIDSPEAKDASPIAQFRRSADYADSPLADVETPLAKFFLTPEGKDSPAYKDNFQVPTNPVNVIRLTLNMLKSAFRLSTFRDVLADIFSSEITSLKVYWVCPMSACPTLVGCSSGFDQRIASGCSHGSTYEGTLRLAEILQGPVATSEEIFVDLDLTTAEQSGITQSDLQRLQNLNDEIAKSANNPNSRASSELGLKQTVVAPCGDCADVAAEGDDDSGFGSEWWHWLLLALAIALLCCSICLAVFFCCCRKTKEKVVEKYEDHPQEKYLPNSSSTSGSSLDHPDAPSPGHYSDKNSGFDSISGADRKTNPINELYPPSAPRSEVQADNEWRPYTVDWGDAGYNDPRPEAQY